MVSDCQSKVEVLIIDMLLVILHHVIDANKTMSVVVDVTDMTSCALVCEVISPHLGEWAIAAHGMYESHEVSLVLL